MVDAEHSTCRNCSKVSLRRTPICQRSGGGLSSPHRAGRCDDADFEPVAGLHQAVHPQFTADQVGDLLARQLAVRPAAVPR